MGQFLQPTRCVLYKLQRDPCCPMCLEVNKCQCRSGPARLPSDEHASLPYHKQRRAWARLRPTAGRLEIELVLRVAEQHVAPPRAATCWTPRTNWTRRVLPPVLSGHVSSFPPPP